VNVLCVVAHPDDEVIGVGGTLARHAAQGDDVHICILADGVSSRYEEISEDVEEKIDKRRERSERACDILGASVSFHEFPDNKFDSVPLLEIVKTVEEEIEKNNSELIYTHHYGDLNIDHEITCRAVMTAARPLPDSHIQKILAFETLSSSEWSMPEKSNSFEPSMFQSIKGFLDTKKKALSVYSNEMRGSDHPRNVKNITKNAELWGVKSGLKVAEPFEILLEVNKN
jgi:LmbE family N-acetylglucosaminyl deacetylase